MIENFVYIDNRELKSLRRGEETHDSHSKKDNQKIKAIDSPLRTFFFRR